MEEAGKIDIHDLHWLMDMLQSIDVGLVVLDQTYNVQVWNNFMENHSGLSSAQSLGKNLFELFPDISKEWFERKVRSVFMLKSQSFSNWEQRPYLFRFKNYRPITGSTEHMYQDVTFIPLVSTAGEVTQIGLMIYDVTNTAINKRELEKANKELERLSRTDGLTKLNNRAYWEDCLKNEFSRCKRTGRDTSVIMFDIDHFKKVNDTYGHQAGDEVIRVVAKMLMDTIRTTDIAGRYGGEEFGLLLIETNSKNSMIVAERLREKIEQTTVIHEGVEIKFTISLGISEFDPEQDNHGQWLERADKALYVSKESGRNMSTIFNADMG
jgi:diguanylate cyclase (GGDEF)-like protein